jgi:formylmethanofuran dehydrogenase subunit E
MTQDRDILLDALKFHGHKCWASTAGVRIGLAAMEDIGVERSGAKSLHAIVEYGDHHGAMCFGDGIQYTTGCTFGKGNVSKEPKGKLAVTLIDKASNRAVRVAYKPTLQKQIKESAFMQKRSAGVSPTEIPEAEQWELVNLIWEAPAEQIMTAGPVRDYTFAEPAEIIRFAVCEGCGELVAEPYLRMVEGKPRCMDCAGYAV